MRRLRPQSLIVACMATLCLCASAQQPLPLSTYIHQSWDKLSRSTTECASVVDAKVPTAPVLYLAANETMPKAVRTMQQQCKVDVRRLPRVIHQEGDVFPEELAKTGLLYLPNRYVVPGGRFNEMYGWDSYFILLGELADGRLDLARGTVENFFYELDFYGTILNANRTYYLTRSQPPFLSSMVLEVYRALKAKNPAEARHFLKRALPYLERDHALWTAAPHLAGDTGLSRYFDVGHGPVPEMGDAATYYVDVLHWLKAHPEAAPPTYTEPAKLTDANASCTAEKPCLQTSADGLQLTEAFFTGDRAMRESGFDTSFRFGLFSGETQDYAPFCLNALLYKYELDIAFVAATLGDSDRAVQWSSTAGVRSARMNALLWDEAQGMFLDYNFATKQHSSYKFLTTYYALWTGLASPEQAKRMVAALPEFERHGGLQTSTSTTGMQWDAPFGWAPLNWLTVAGLEHYGFHADAQRLARKFNATVNAAYQRDGTIREKYDMNTGSADVVVTNGYKENVIGFGWTNGVYLKMQELLAQPVTQPAATPTP